MLRHLRPQFERVRPPQIVYYGLQQLGEPCSVLLSTLARASQCDDKFAFESGARLLPEVPLEFLPAERCRLSDLQAALEQLSQVAAKHRGRLVDASAAAICADAEVRVEEAELLRGICDMLDCPMPPLLPGQRVAVQAGRVMNPSASFAALEQRADLLRRLREFFHERGFLEVETPLVADEVIPELHIEPLRLGLSLP